MRRVPDLPAITDDKAELRRLLNDRLRKLEELTAAGGSSGGVTIEQVNAQIAALAARLDAKIAAVQAKASTVTVTGGQVVFSVPGILAIESDAAPLVAFKENRNVTEVALLAKQAPAGAQLALAIVVSGVSVATVALPDGQSAITSTVAFAIGAAAPVRIDVTGVGTTFPGADLSVILRY